MIYTVTFNPAIDYIVDIDEFKLGQVNRTSTEQVLPGGKGINVSIVLGNLGFENTALGFLAGFTGDKIEECMSCYNIKTDFIHVKDGMSRINVKVKGTRETEINGMGPNVGKDELDILYRRISTLSEGDILVLAGSINASLPDTVYADILNVLVGKNVKVVVDATGNLLRNVLKFKPFMVKPNIYELSQIYGVSIESRDDVIKYANMLRKEGAVNVLVSMGKDGAILIDENGNVYEREAPSGKVINTVGSGDSMVAGFIAGYLEKGDYSHALKMGLAAGSASAFSAYLATKDEVLDVYRRS
ncbi:MAG: 1-phosphofructokinase [Lachnospiraceae bacterium]|nr:1-phosphofructokinase [Lachnospiraceae bacterium]